MKKVFAMLLCTAMIAGLFAACGSASSSTPVSASSNTPVSEAGSSAGTGTEVQDLSKQEPYTVRILCFGTANSADVDLVSEELSKLSLAKFNTKIEIIKDGFGTYRQTMNMMLSSGEKLDLVANLGTVSALVGNGQLAPMNDLLEKYGKNTLNAISESDWACTTIGGKIYGIPSNKDKAFTFGFCMTKSIVDEMKIDTTKIKTLDDIHDVLVEVKKAYPNMYPLASSTGTMWEPMPVDHLGSQNTYLGVLADPYNSDSLTVENMYATEMYYNLVDTMYKWNKEGLLMPDGATNTETNMSLRSSGMLFGNFARMKPGFDQQESRSSLPVVSVELYPAFSTTSSVTMGWSIAQNSEKPERAMQILDWLYNDPEASNISIYGVENVHWKVNANGTASYADGVDASNTGYPMVPWGWLNQQISYVWENEPTDIWAQLGTFNATAKNSPAKGFLFDSNPVINEITACTNVVTKYHNALMNGQLDPAIAIPQFNSELEASGINKIIEEKQKQLDAWAATQK